MKTRILATLALLFLIVSNIRAQISGPSYVGLGAHVFYTVSPGGGTWYAATTNVTIDPVTGELVAGMVLGTAGIYYLYPDGSGLNFQLQLIECTGFTISSSANVSICSGQSATLSVSGGETYVWSPSSSLSSSSGSSVVSTPTVTTTYTITGYDTAGCSSNAAITVTVNPVPVITGTSITICNHSSGTLSATGAATYEWSPAIGLASTTGSYVIASPTTTTTYSVLGVNTYGCVGMAVATVNVIDLPVVTGITGTLSVCPNSNVTLTGSPIGGTWSSSTLSVATINSSTGMVHSIAAGNSTISYAVSNSCGTSYGTAVVTVNPLPFAGTITPSSTISLCSYDNITPTSSGDPGGTWSLTTSTQASINATTGNIATVAVSSAVTLTASYTVTNSCGTTLTSRSVRLKRNPTFTQSPSGGGPYICNGETITITTTPGSSGSYFQWGGSGIAVSTVSSNIALVTATSLATGTANTLTYTYTNALDATYCATMIPIRTYTIAAKPTYTITGTSVLSTGAGSCAPNAATLTILTTPSGIAGTSVNPNWTWTPTSPTTYATLSCSTCVNNTVTAVASTGNEILTYSAYGSYCTVPVTATFTVTVNPCKEAPNGVEDNDNIKGLQIYPNPTFGSFTIELPDASSSAITVTDISGRVIATRISIKQKEDFDLGNYPRGMYFINVDTENKKYRHKVLIE